MDILNFHTKLIDNYKSYIQSFLTIKDPKILEFVDAEIENKKLWPEPLVQFNPTFEQGKPISDLVHSGSLHPELNAIFKGFDLYKHQVEAILLGSSGREFVVTSGTGSGKSLTYIATIFNHVLNMGDSIAGKTQAIIVYPMNALINSQFKEIQKYKEAYETNFNKPFPISFGQFTGQETEEQRDELRSKPPHILLTNYVMLELLMTRSGKDNDIRANFLQNMRYLVFDELHTYRGRQGSDVSILIRRIKKAADHHITCIGTSATMVSGDSKSLLEQRQKVAEVASTIFGSNIKEDQVVNEYLVKSIGAGLTATPDDVRKAVDEGISKHWSAEVFEQHATANWVEEHIALERKEGVYVRRKPLELQNIAAILADFTGIEKSSAQKHLEELLEWANLLNTRPDKKKNYLPYRIHQFIAQTGSVYSTLGDQNTRTLFLDAGLYADSEEVKLFPLVFSRTSGHEFMSVRLDMNASQILPREYDDILDDLDENSTEEGYVFIEHKEDDEPIWDPVRDLEDLPESWFSTQKRNGSTRLQADRERRLPRKIWFTKTGDFSFTEPLEFEAWYMPMPMMFDPSSGTLFDTKTAEWTKVMKLGGEGRSTATTVLSFETITQLQAFGEADEKQKLLSFTDNRQDASLQAGHFNDFVKVGQLRAAIAKALDTYGSLDYSTISDKIFECLNIAQDQFARQPASFPGPKKENEDAFKDFIMYRVIHDLRRSWRVVLPNLEQCALLDIDYKYLSESVANPALWQSNELLRLMSGDERHQFLVQVLDFFRKSFALHYSLLEPNVLSTNSTRFREKLISPWTLDDQEKLEQACYIRLEKLSSSSRHLFTESGGPRSVFARYVKSTAASYGLDIRGDQAYIDFTKSLLDILTEAGWLSRKAAKTQQDTDTSIYQLNVDLILWKKGDGMRLRHDLIRNRSYKTLNLKPNAYFQRFYRTNFQDLKPIEGREHTGQIGTNDRKSREEGFRAGKIGALFCSPTMELGIDISDLSIVHMRNVPPSPANYAQRSGRAGRSGQAALVVVYCSNYSAHDRHYFKHATSMVAGSVTAPRMDLINEELLLSHLNATILTRRSIRSLNTSLGDIVDRDDLMHLALKEEVKEALRLTEAEKEELFLHFRDVVQDTYFETERLRRKPSWFTDDWIRRNIDQFEQNFDQSVDRWRVLYRAAQQQIKNANTIIENRIYADNHDLRKEAHRNVRQAERQRDLLLNDIRSNRGGNQRQSDQSEFYPYRYLAAEGFLPGYNFTRLPVRSFLEREDGGGEYVSRARFVSLNEFGPQNVIYHDGAKYRIDRMMLNDAELKLESAKICPKTGYFLYDDQYTFEVDPIINEPLELDPGKHIHTTLLPMAESRAYQLQRITCQEEERTKKGYEIQTYFSVDGGFNNTTTEGIVRLGEDELLHLHYIPTCRLYRLNLKWRSSTEHGFTINLKSGTWLSKKQKQEKIENGQGEDIRDVKLVTSTTANALYIQPVTSLALEGGKSGVITLMYAIKRAIEHYFQVESNEIGTTIMGELDAPNILIYEASEGSLGVLSQLVDSPSMFTSVMSEACKICFYDNGVEHEGKVLPATYDDLLSYYNQYHHPLIDRNLIRGALKKLSESSVEIKTNNNFDTYEEHYRFLQSARDQNSATEEAFLTYLYKRGLKLPDEAQPNVKQMYVRPDFLYKPNVYVFCDGSPHDRGEIIQDDADKRSALRDAGYQVLSWYYRDALDDFVATRPDIFKKVKK